MRCGLRGQTQIGRGGLLLIGISMRFEIVFFHWATSSSSLRHRNVYVAKRGSEASGTAQ